MKCCIFQSTKLIVSLVFIIGVLISDSETLAESRTIDASDGYAALLTGTQPESLADLRQFLDQRCGYYATATHCDATLDVNMRRWVNEIKGKSQIVLFYYEGLVALSEDKIVLGKINLEEILNQFERSQASEYVLIINSQGNVDLHQLQKQLNSVIQSNVNRAQIHLLASHCERTDEFRELLVRRLSRGADLNHTVELNFEELIRQFKHSNVALASASSGNGERSIVRRRQLSIQELLSDLAEETAQRLKENDIDVIAVPDVVLKEGLSLPDNVPGQNYGEILRTSATRLRRELAIRSQFSYRVLGDDWLRNILQETGMSPAEISGPALLDAYEKMKLHQLPAAAADKPVALMALDLRHDLDQPAQITLTGTVWSIPDGTPLVNDFQRVAIMNSSEWSETGYSGVNRVAMKSFREEVEKNQQHYSPPSEVNSRKIKPLETIDYFADEELEQIISSVEELSRPNEHPLLDTTFPFQLFMKSNGEYKTFHRSHDGRHVYVDVKEGEEYQLVVANNSESNVFMRLLVDGLNTLPDHPLTTKEGIYEVARKNERVPVDVAQIASLTNAKAWYCAPGRFQINGFFTSIHHNGSAELAKFVVTDSTHSEAWNKGYRKDIGIVTAAFYAPLQKPKDLAPRANYGTRLGGKSRTKLDFYRGQHVPGELLAVIHLRYGIQNQSVLAEN